MPRKRTEKWQPGQPLAVSTILTPGVAERFVRYCTVTERTNSGTLRLFVKRMLEHEDF